MKTILVLLLLTSISAGANNLEEAIIKNCTVASTFGGVVMEARQLGFDKQELLAISGDEEYMQSITINAYKVAKYEGQDARLRAISSYKRFVMLDCIDKHTLTN